eukprot:CAMPEP_0194067370 /NCGR_PEP_ID=MMETSP0009_2-20130614/86520_1 /TAXON_ID=210454 /ORGANISM="Grammatophora oceanica, Strain CCMP 410" /LENGTH=1154 /DNA_ID=CAMNT_0038720387 /DNA_START=37 /DNA_END=3502 /DNA_ORIENTATION=-
METRHESSHLYPKRARSPHESGETTQDSVLDADAGTLVSGISDDRTTRRLEETTQKIGFEKSLPLCGRSGEKDLLLKAFAEIVGDKGGPTQTVIVMRGHSGCGKSALVEKRSAAFAKITGGKGRPTQAVVMRGPSGCGKSALVEKTFRNFFDDGDHSATKGWFVMGKFDQYSGRNDPFSAVVAAITNLIELIDYNGLVHLYEDDVREAIKENESSFACIIPNLSSITNRHKEITSLRPLSSMAFRQFISTFRALFSALCRREYPVVLFLDDLQWMDDATFELLEALVAPQDPSSATRHLLVVGAIRSDDPWTPIVLNRLNEGLRRKSSDDQSIESINYVDVDNVDESTVAEMVAARLGMPKANCSSLSKIVQEKTMGCPFAVLGFLDLIASKEFLSYQNRSWVWDESKIQSETNVSNNVLELAQCNIERLPKSLTDLLAVAAFLGFEFEGETLLGLARCDYLETLANPAMTELELMSHLNRARKEGLVEKTGQKQDGAARAGTTRYKFSHDKVQQALYMSVVDSDAQLIHRAVGLYLWDEMGETNGIEVAEHLNRAEPLVDARSLLIEVNYAAAKIARAKQSFPLSAKYLNCALSLLGPDKWTGHYDHSLDMSTFLVELYVACGNRTEIEAVSHEVLQHARCLEDKESVVLSNVSFLCSRCEYADAIAYAKSAVRLCGKRIPKNPGLLQILFLLSAVRRLTARLTDDDIIKLPAVTDKKVKYHLELCSNLATLASMTDDSSLQVWCALRAVQLSLAHGVSTATPMALALLGALEAALGNFNVAARFGHLSTKLVEERELGPEATAQVYSLASCIVLHWSEPMDGPMSALPKSGMEIDVLGGELIYVFFSAATNFGMMQIRGVPLGLVEREARAACLKMKAFNAENNLNMAKPHWQFVLNLLGNSENPLVLSGEAMNEAEHLSDPMVKGSSTLQMLFTYQKFRLTRLLGSYELAEQHATTLTKDFKDYTFRVGFPIFDIKLNLALLWYHCARESTRGRQRRRYLLKARNEVKFMRVMKAKGCPNFDSILPILEAEEASFVLEQPLVVGRLYDAAIARARGKLHHEAIALEQAALFYIGRDDMSAGGAYMRRAVSTYMKWNAYAKVATLLDRYEPLGMFCDDATIKRMTLCVPALDGASSAGSGPSQREQKLSNGL